MSQFSLSFERNLPFTWLRLGAVLLAILPSWTLSAAEPLRIGSAIQSPHAFQKNAASQPEGFFVDVLKEAGRYLDRDVQWVLTPLSMEKAMASGLIDVYAGAFATPERRKTNYFSEPWWTEDYYLVVREDSGIRNGAQLQARTLLFETRPVLPVAVSKAFPGSTPVLMDNRSERLETVCKTPGVAGLFSQTSLYVLRSSFPETCRGVNLRVIPQNIHLGLSIVASLENVRLADDLRRAIRAMEASGRLTQVANAHAMFPIPDDYFNQPSAAPEHTTLQLVAGGALLGSGLLALGFAGARLLKRRRVTGMPHEDVRANPTASRDVFLATMSHEIRTPLSAILGFADLLQETPLLREQQILLRDIRSATTNLVTMLTDVMEFTRLRAGHAPTPSEPVDLPQLIGDAVSTVSLQAEAKQLDFIVWLDPSLPSEVYLSKNSCRQVLVNLLANAMKFTKEGYIRLGVEPSPKDPSCLRIVVADTGSGIPRSEQNRVFEAFRQVDSSDRRGHGGIGLGLAIVKELVHAMEGMLTLESTEGFGSRFTVDLPLRPVPATRPWIDKFRVESPLPVQIIGTLSGNIEILRNYLLAAGYDVEISEDERSALSRMAGRKSISHILVHYSALESPAEFVDWARRMLPNLEKITAVGTLTGYRLIPPDTRDLFDEYLHFPIGLASLRNLQLVKEKAAPLTARTYAGGKVLVVDDNAINRRVICGLLTNLGMTSDSAENGQDAFEKCRKGKYDLVLMDCQMPVMDGYEATQSIRALIPGGNSQIIVGTSANIDLETEMLCGKAGMNRFLAKPITRASLENLLNALQTISGESGK